ncbi:MAG: nickel pincer cofactor biosynthesis protein LarB [Thermoplasmata archaeon]
MNAEEIKSILEGVRSGAVSVEEGMQRLKTFPFIDLGFAKLDTHRDLRKGFPEVVFCQGKSPEQAKEIVERLSSQSDVILATRAGPSVYEAIKTVRLDAIYHEQAKVIVIGKYREKKGKKEILVITAGTADIPVAEEAAITAEVMGNEVVRLYDTGVAGIHRLFKYQDRIERAGVLIVIAGMEGALASVVGGLVDKPVIAVPTSIGYGASFGGLSALLTMLNTCAPGVAVVNIDNGFGAGYIASLINRCCE